MSDHVVPIRLYLAVFLALLGLTALTVWVAFLDLGYLNNVVALGIASLKATLVVLYFMHVRWGTRLTALIVVSSVAWLLILLLFTLSDYLSRDWLGVAGGA